MPEVNITEVASSEISMPSSSRFPSSWKYRIILVVVVALVYGQCLTFDFVNYDDFDLVKENGTYLSELSNIVTSFTTHVFSGKRNEGVYYRPMLQATYILDYHVWGLWPFGYHLVNLLFHVASAFIVFGIARLLLHQDISALFVAVLFSLHPIQSESVAWVAGRNDVLLGLFLLLMLYFHIRQHDEIQRRKLFRGLSILSFILALFTKEAAAFFIILPFLYDVAVRGKRPKEFLSLGSTTYFGGLVIALAGYLIIRLNIFGAFIGSEKLYSRFTLGERLLQVPAMLTEHLKLLIVPANLNVTHPMENILWFTVPWNYLAFAISLLLPVLVWLTWRRDRILCFGLLWMMVGLLPTLNIFPVAVPVLEHRLYIAVGGLATVIVRGISLLMERYRQERLTRGVMAGILIIAAGMTTMRLPVWKDSESLWLDALEKAPNSSRAYLNLAGFYYEKKQFGKTSDLLFQYRKLKPEDHSILQRMRQSLFLAGRYPEAAAICREMITLDPDNPNRYFDAGILFERLGMADSAIAVYDEGLLRDSNWYQLQLRRAGVLDHSGQTSGALEGYRQTIRAIEQQAQTSGSSSELDQLLVQIKQRVEQLSTSPKSRQ